MPPKSSPEVPDWFKSDRVLVLQDDPQLRDGLVNTLNASKFAAQGALSPEDAQERCRRENFEMVLAGPCHSWTPDGPASLAAFRSRRPESCCLMVTLEPNDELARRAIDLQVNDYLWGPFELALVASAREALASGYDRKQLRKTLAPPVRLVPASGNQPAEDQRFREEAIARLEVQRERALRGVYLAIRSQLVSKAGGLYLWDQLEPLENGFEQATRTPADATDIHERAMAYEALVDRMLSRELAADVAAARVRSQWMIDRATFNRFYDRVAAGKINAEQVRLASWLRRMAPRQRADQPAREPLYRLLWE